MEAQYTMEELKAMQAWPLKKKIAVTKTRIVEWYQYWNEMVYVPFSGGKDSTVLLYLVRSIYPEVPAAFSDTGLEYPEIREFVKLFDHVEWLHPVEWDRKTRQYRRTNFRNAIEKYGYPLVSKEQAAFIQECRDTKSEKLRNIRINGNKHGRGKISKKWLPLVEAPFKVSDKCCDVMKKHPSILYERETGRHPIMGTTTVESKQRESNWLLYGCNAFSKGRPTSQPLSFWTEDDILGFLTIYHDDILRMIDANIKHPWASIYGDIIYEDGHYKTTGAERTGCIFCGFGAQCDKSPTRFEKLKETHPKQYEYCMKPWEDGGLGMSDVLDFIGVKY